MMMQLRFFGILILMIAFTASTANCVGASASKSPVIWFCPLDPLVRPEVGYGGAPGYMDLFKADAPWKRAASHVSVFKIYPQWIGMATDANLRIQFADLKRRHIALALEFGPLTAGDGQGGEGFGGQSLLPVVRRIHSDGGELSYVAMDEPIFFGTIRSPRPFTPSEMADNAAVNIRAMWQEFPNVQVGDIEPLVNTAEMGLTDPQLIKRYTEGVNEFARVLGKPLSFFDCDLDWHSAEYPARLADTAKMARAAGVAFGVIYNGDSTDSDDASWLQSARRHMAAAEEAVGTPDIVIFQSWNAHPEKLLPETDRDAFTSIVDDYFNTRTHLSASMDHKSLSGRLSDVDDAPVSGAVITASLHRVNSPGALAEYTATGTVPTGAKMAVIGIRVNSEGATPGDCNVDVRSMRYERAGQPPVVRAFANTSDVAVWPPFGKSADGATTAINGGDLELTLTSSQTEILNSAPFPVNAADDFRFVVNAKIPTSSAGHGSFILVFLSDKTEVSRTVIPFDVPAITVTSAVTGADGRWRITIPSNGALQAECTYNGDASHWPSKATAQR